MNILNNMVVLIVIMVSIYAPANAITTLQIIEEQSSISHLILVCATQTEGLALCHQEEQRYQISGSFDLTYNRSYKTTEALRLTPSNIVTTLPEGSKFEFPTYWMTNETGSFLGSDGPCNFLPPSWSCTSSGIFGWAKGTYDGTTLILQGLAPYGFQLFYDYTITAKVIQDTNTATHDLAVTTITPPRQVTLTSKKPSVTKTVKVSFQNRGTQTESITNSNKLKQLVQLKVESLGTCPAPTTELVTQKLDRLMPVNIKPKQILSVEFSVTFDCANDPIATTRKNAGHGDYRYAATVDNSGVFGGFADAHKADDVCPRSVTPPYEIDVYPDGKIKDRGCGAKKLDMTFGADVITDVLVR